jgi:hypothetical protein
MLSAPALSEDIPVQCITSHPSQQGGMLSTRGSKSPAVTPTKSPAESRLSESGEKMQRQLGLELREDTSDDPLGI